MGRHEPRGLQANEAQALVSQQGREGQAKTQRHPLTNKQRQSRNSWGNSSLGRTEPRSKNEAWEKGGPRAHQELLSLKMQGHSHLPPTQAQLRQASTKMGACWIIQLPRAARPGLQKQGHRRGNPPGNADSVPPMGKEKEAAPVP